MQPTKELTSEERQALDFMINKFCEFIKEDPAIIGAMARGYKAQFYFTTNPENEKMITIKCDVISKDGATMTLEELFAMERSKKVEQNNQPK